MSLSPVAVQISILREALEEQQKYVRKRPLDLSLDEKCCNEMKKLQQLMFGQKKRNLNFVDLSQLYSILLDSEKSFDAGIQRIMGKTFGSMVVDTHNGKSLWEIAKAAKEDVFRACLVGVVDEWAHMGAEEENREEAKSRILNFLANPNQTDLDVSRLFLQDLPDIFRGEITKRLTTLNVSCNKIIILPESIGNLTALQTLDVRLNQLTGIPKSIGNLKALQKLNVTGNHLTGVPESIGNLLALEDKEHIFRACLVGVVDEWAQMGAEGENREEAKSRILNFLTNPNQTDLDLSSLFLQDLPDIFHGEITKRLTTLNVSSNKIIILPESIGNLLALEDLDISSMKLGAIPETIKYLTRLKKLNISYNPLGTLPEWIRYLVELEELDAVYIEIAFLPAWIGDLRNLKRFNVDENEELTTLPDSIGELSNLKKLQIYQCGLMSLPESMRNLRNLADLLAGSNYLESVPEWIGTLTQLEHLNFSDNELIALPENIGNLRNLKILNLEGNSLLGSLPNTVFELPNTCKVDLEDCGFSLRVQDNLQAIMRAPGYSGPQISFYNDDEAGPYQEKTLEEVLKDLSEIAERQITFSEDLMDASQKSLLEIWLNRICEIADYKSSEGTKKEIVSKVLDYLEEMVRNEEFRDVFYQVIADATRTCGDRVALSLLHIGLAYDESKIELRGTQNLAQFLIRGVFVMSLLEDAARTKIPTLKLVDEIEVYLAYPILLKERLQIPINVGKMLYLRCAGLTDQDLNNAETYVKEQIENKDAVCSFLVDQPRWEKALESSFPAETAKLKAERMTKLEEGLSQVTEIDKEYKNALKNLTNSLIN